MDHGGLEPGVGNIEAVVALVQRRPGKPVRGAIAALGEVLDRDAARISEGEVLGNLVERFAAGVIDGGAHHLDAVESVHLGDQRVATGQQQPDVGIGEVVLHVRGVEVRLHVIDRDHRQVARQCQTLGVGQPYQQGSDQSGTGGDRHRVDRVQIDRGIGEGMFDHAIDPLDVLAAGDLRDYALVAPVFLDLGVDNVAVHGRAVGHHRGSALIARCLDSQYGHGVASAAPPSPVVLGRLDSLTALPSNGTSSESGTTT